MVFIRPTILLDSVQTAFETNQKYNYIRNLQMSQEKSAQLLPDLPPQAEQEPPVIDLRLPPAQEPADAPED